MARRSVATSPCGCSLFLPTSMRWVQHRTRIRNKCTIEGGKSIVSIQGIWYLIILAFHLLEAHPSSINIWNQANLEARMHQSERSNKVICRCVATIFAAVWVQPRIRRRSSSHLGSKFSLDKGDSCFKVTCIMWIWNNTYINKYK